jgi:hypothetical protein
VVVVVGGVGLGVGAGGGALVVCAGAAGAARRAGLGLGASTVTCGTEIVGAAPGVSGCAGCGAGVSAGGVSGAVGAGGVSGVVVAGGVSGGGAGVWDGATPAEQSNMSAELLSRNKRLLWIHIAPNPPTSAAAISAAHCRRSLAGARLAGC